MMEGAAAQHIAHQSAKHHSRREAPEGRAVDPANLLVGRPEFGSPDTTRFTAQSKTHHGYDQSHAAGPKNCVDLIASLPIL